MGIYPFEKTKDILTIGNFSKYETKLSSNIKKTAKSAEIGAALAILSL